MSLDGNATSTSVLRGTIHNLIIDKTLSISGAAADSKAVADAIAAITGESVVIPVERGGTGATDAATARANLGASAVGHTHTPASIGAASASHTHTAADVGAVPTTGGTLTGDLTVEKTNDTVMIGIANSNRKVVFQLSSSNNAGIYDATNKKWLIYHDGANDRLLTAIAPKPNDISLRRIQGGTSDMTAGSSSLTIGQLYVVYE